MESKGMLREKRMLREIVIGGVMSNLKINREEALRYLDMPLDEQRRYIKGIYGKEMYARQELPVTSRTH